MIYRDGGIFMPIKLDKELPALDILRSENVFIMDNTRANNQNIRPLEVLIINLMPTKQATETQLLRLLANTPLQTNVTFLYMQSHHSKNTHAEHLETFYKTFPEIKNNFYDGLIITGAPVETLKFEEVDYWKELCEIFAWSKKHVYSTLHLCWGAQASLYYHYGIEKVQMPCKLSGIFTQVVSEENSPLMRGFDDNFLSPHSRYTEILEADLKKVDHLKVLAYGNRVGISIVASSDMREVYSFGHLEYDRDTLDKEYHRDIDAGKHPNIPESYYPDDDSQQLPKMRWNLPASTFFSNWLNYAVYQGTPYQLQDLDSKTVLE